ncbi:MAG: hypothetical protein FJ117_02830 [Deltaproteobacteria bacterium]|nr:hypothetical protein [Deltaproteobacteria bacterium]
MDPNFSDIYLLQHLENIASQLGIDVRYESLSDEEISVHSGGCKLSGRNLIIIDTRHPAPERAKILGRELSGYDLEDLYILPRVREFILLHSPLREKNRPQT